MAAEPAPTEVATFPAARRGILARLSAGHVLMIVAGLLGLVLTMVAIRAANQTERVAVAADAIEPGRTVVPEDIHWVEVRLTDELAARAVHPDELDGLGRMVAVASIPAGDLLSEADFRPVAADGGKRAMSVPIDPSRAVNGELVAGDRVDVLVARGAEVEVTIANAEVLDVHDPGGGALGNVDAQFAITLAVDVRESQLLTAAIADGELVVTRSTGADTADQAPPLVVTGLATP
ncbi:MAG: RcpC/CpaB family pilus assembly protein [Acidimicrobiia bacterium]